MSTCPATSVAERRAVPIDAEWIRQRQRHLPPRRVRRRRGHRETPPAPPEDRTDTLPGRSPPHRQPARIHIRFAQLTQAPRNVFIVRCPSGVTRIRQRAVGARRRSGADGKCTPAARMSWPNTAPSWSSATLPRYATRAPSAGRHRAGVRSRPAAALLPRPASRRTGAPPLGVDQRHAPLCMSWRDRTLVRARHHVDDGVADAQNIECCVCHVLPFQAACCPNVIACEARQSRLTCHSEISSDHRVIASDHRPAAADPPRINRQSEGESAPPPLVAGGLGGWGRTTAVQCVHAPLPQPLRGRSSPARHGPSPRPTSRRDGAGRRHGQRSGHGWPRRRGIVAHQVDAVGKACSGARLQCRRHLSPSLSGGGACRTIVCWPDSASRP